MINAWLIYGEEDSKKNRWYIDEYIKEGLLLNIKVTLLIEEYISIGVKEDEWMITYQQERIDLPDVAIVRTIYPMLNRQLELLGIPTFNNSKVAEICNDKARTYQYVAKTKLKMVDTTFCRWKEFDSKLALIDSETVVKTVSGHGGSEVYLVDKESKDTLKNNFATDFVMQPLIGAKHQDLRVYVLGKEILACILRTANQGFKSNFSLGGSVCEYMLSEKERQQVDKIIELFDFGLVGIDFIIDDNNNLVFNEIEDVVGARMLYQCKDINLVHRYLEFILSKIGL